MKGMRLFRDVVAEQKVDVTVARNYVILLKVGFDLLREGVVAVITKDVSELTKGMVLLKENMTLARGVDVLRVRIC